MAVKSLNETSEIRDVPSILDLAPGANSLDEIWVAPTAFVDGIDFLQTGREVIHVMNTHASSPFTFTVKSISDPLKRTGDIGPYTLQAGEVCCFVLPFSGF